MQDKHLIVIMDSIEEIKPSKDSSFAMLLAAKQRGIPSFYLKQEQLTRQTDGVYGWMQRIDVFDQAENYHQLSDPIKHRFDQGDVVLMRKDPPVDAAFMATTWLLDLIQAQGAKVVNNPQGLRDMNEKLQALRFPELIPPTLISRLSDDIEAFVLEHKNCVIKPLDGMGGRGIFRLRHDDDNRRSIISSVTEAGQSHAMVQTYLPAIADGDKRILLVDGTPMPHCLARIPSGTDFRGNLAAGGRGEVRPLSDSDRHIGQTVGKVMREHGMRFVGIDVIGDRLTEVNVTSPTCIREIHAATGCDIAGIFLDAVFNT